MADPAARMALRRHPLVLAVLLSDLTVRALDLARALAHEVADRPARALALDLALALYDMLTVGRNSHLHDGELSYMVRVDLDRAIDRTDLDGIKRDLSDDLDQALHRTRLFARSLDLSRARFGELARELADTDIRALIDALDRSLSLDRTDPDGIERDLSDDLDQALDRARDIVRARALALDRARDLADDLDLHASLMVSAALGIKQVEGLAAAVLSGALDDFTHADLTYVDLAGHELTGVRWSDPGTKWPRETNIYALRKRSRETDPGIYVILAPGTEEKDPNPRPVAR